MFAVSSARLARLGGWPRRLAALGCLLLAAVSALGARHHSAAEAASATHVAGNPIARHLHTGQVAAPVSITAGARYLHRGDRVDLFVTAAADTVTPGCTGGTATNPVATGLRVLAVTDARPGEDTSELLLAVGPAIAARIATLQRCGMFAVLDKYP